MQYTIALLALVASVSAQTANPSPTADGYEDAPCNTCVRSWNGNFLIQIHNLSVPDASGKNYTAGDKIQLPSCTTNPIISLKNGQLYDQDKRTAEVLSNNRQFQFDDPLQDKRAYASGFEACLQPAGTFWLAHGNANTTFSSCRSGDFSNLYEFGDQAALPNCDEVRIEVLFCPNSSPDFGSCSGSSSAVATSSSASTSSSSMIPTTMSSTSVSLTDVSISTPVSAPATTAPATGAAPYPTGNATVPAASGTGSPSSTAPGGSTSSPATAPASGAQILSVGGQVGALAVAAVAFALL